MHRKKFIAFGLVLLAILTACSGGTTTAPQTSNSTPSSGYVLPTPVPVNSPLVGNYTTTITKQDGTWMVANPAVIIPNSVGSVSLGAWLIEFRSDGYYTAQGPNSNASAQYEGLGQYAIKGHLLIITDVKCWEFNGPQAHTASYVWILQGKLLRLQPVGKDLCSTRKLLLTSHTLSKQS